MATISLDPRLDKKTSDFIAQKHRMYIDGKFVNAASGKTLSIYNPATGEVMAQVPEAEAGDDDRAVGGVRRAFDEGPWTKMSAAERGRLMLKLADLMEQYLEELAEIE